MVKTGHGIGFVRYYQSARLFRSRYIIDAMSKESRDAENQALDRFILPLLDRGIVTDFISRSLS